MKVRTFLIVMCLVVVSSVIIVDADAGGSRIIPSAPNSVGAEPMDNKVKITWDFPTGFTGDDLLGFTVKKGSSSDSINSIIANLGPFVLTYTDTPLTNGVTYYYTVTAINADGSGPASDYVSSVPRGPSSKPYNFTSAYGSNYVYLTWEDPSDTNGSPVSGYTVYKGFSENNVTIRNDVGMDTDYTDPGLINGKTYYYQVLAITEYGDGTRSERLAVAPKTTPSFPFNVTLTPGDKEIHISWNRSEDDGGAFVQSYWIYRGFASDNMSKIGHTQDSLETTFTDSGVENGVTYFYAVAGYNTEGVGEFSLVTAVIPLGPPGKPMNLTLIPGNANITLVWKLPEFNGGTEILGYRIYMRTYDQADMALNAEIGDQLSYMVENLENGLIHYFQVKAFNDIGEGPGTPPEMIRPEPLPKTPENFNVQDLEGRVKLVWSKPAYTGEYDYETINVYRGIEEESLSLVDQIPTDLSYYYDEELEIGVVYYYEISITSEIGEGLRTPVSIGRPFGRPSAPNDLSIIFSSKSATLTWSHPDFSGGRVIDNFKIFRGTNMDTMTSLVEVLGTVLIYNDTGLTNGRTYYYMISAVNSQMEGNATEVVIGTPLGPPGNPLEAKGIFDDQNKTISITWTDPSNDGGVNISSYKLYRGIQSDNLSFYKEILPGEQLMDDDLEEGVEYFYRITAINDEGEGGSSIEFSVLIPEKIAEEDDEGGGVLIWVLIIFIVVILMGCLIGFAIYQSNKKKVEQEKEEAPILEESESEKEERLILERRKMMGEFTDVALNTEMAHSGDHEQHNLSYQDLYGSPEEKQQDYVNQTNSPQPEAPQQEVIQGPVQGEIPAQQEQPVEIHLPGEPEQTTPPAQE